MYVQGATDCHNGQFYEKPGSCVDFYICVNGQLIERHCAPGLLYSKELGMCDWAESVDCTSGDGNRKDIIRQECESVICLYSKLILEDMRFSYKFEKLHSFSCFSTKDCLDPLQIRKLFFD